jgi:hypothetical protein
MVGGEVGPENSCYHIPRSRPPENPRWGLIRVPHEVAFFGLELCYSSCRRPLLGHLQIVSSLVLLSSTGGVSHPLGTIGRIKCPPLNHTLSTTSIDCRLETTRTFTFLASDVITLLDFHRRRHTLRYIQTLLSVLTISSRVYLVFAIFCFESTHLSDNTEMSKLTQRVTVRRTALLGLS